MSILRGIKSFFSSRREFKDLAKKHNISVSKLLDGYVALGFIVDKYYGPKSELIITNTIADGAECDLIIPFKGLMEMK